MFSNIDAFYIIKNFDLKDAADLGIIRLSNSSQWLFVGILAKQNSNSACFYSALASFAAHRFTFEGNGVGVSQVGMHSASSGGLALTDGAIYNMGDIGLNTTSICKFSNLNVGIEMPNGDDDFFFHTQGFVYGKDVNMGGTNGLVNSIRPFASPHKVILATIENYGKVLGEHRMFYPGGIAQRSAVTGENPNKKLSDYVLKITPNIDYAYKYEEGQCVLFEHEYQLNSGSNTIKYWLYNDVGVTLNNRDAMADIYLVAEYVDSFGDTTAYTITKAYSTQDTISAAADADDWDFLSATMTLAIASKVRVRLLISYYDLTGDIFIDPLGVLT